MSPRNRALLVFSFSLLHCFVPAACAQEDRKQESSSIVLSSCYLVHPLTIRDVGKAHRVFLECNLEGDAGGVLHLDPNTCTLSPFGDPLACTEMAAQPHRVTLKQAKVDDPQGRGRRLFLLEGLPGKAKVHLVVPRAGEAGHRLVVHDEEGEVAAVVPLVPKADPAREGAGKK